MKYIDSEKLIAKLTKMQFDINAAYRHPQSDNIVRAISLEYDDIISLVSSLQQEQNRIMKDYPYMPGWRLNKENNKPAIKHSILMLTTHGIAEGEWNGNEWIQYRWSCKVNDSDVLYWMHLEDLTQLEKEGDFFQQERPEATSIKGYLSRDIGGQLIISLSPNYMDDEWMLLESKLFPNIKSGGAPRCINIIVKEIK